MFLGFFYSKIILEIRKKVQEKTPMAGSEVIPKDYRTTTSTGDSSKWNSHFKGQIYIPKKSRRKNEDNMDPIITPDIIPEKWLTLNYNQIGVKRTSLHILNSSVLQLHCLPPLAHSVSFFDISKAKLEYSRLCRSQEIVFCKENKAILKLSCTKSKSTNKLDNELSCNAIPRQFNEPTYLPLIPTQMKFGKLRRLNKSLPEKCHKKNSHRSNKNTFGNGR